MLTIQDVLLLGNLTGLQLRAGATGVSNEVTTVTIMDIPDIADWLKAGELVISGVLFEECFTVEMINTLIEKKVPGLITKEKFTLKVSDEVFRYCEEVGFPVILVPSGYSWEQVMNPIFDAIIRRPYRIIEESQKIYFTLISAMIDCASLSEICSRFHRVTGFSHAVVDSDFYFIGSSNDTEWKVFTRNLDLNMLKKLELTASSKTTGRHQTYYFEYHTDNKKSVFYSVVLNEIKYGYIIISLDHNNHFSDFDIVIIQQLGLVVSLYVTKMIEISNATRKFNDVIIDRLLSEKELSQTNASLLLSPLGKKLHRQYIIACILHKNNNVAEIINKAIIRFHDMLNKELENSEHTIIFERFNAQMILIPYPSSNFEKTITDIRKLFMTATHFKYFYIGVSEPVLLEDIKKGFIQAKATASYIMSIDSHAIYYQYNQLGILRFFIENTSGLSKPFLQEMHMTYIKPLLDYDAIHSTRLLDTVINYIKNDCSKTKTEKTLFIHKNTLIARFNTISKIINYDINNAEVFFNLYLAIKIHQSLTVSGFTLY